jgi:hypothetical protein
MSLNPFALRKRLALFVLWALALLVPAWDAVAQRILDESLTGLGEAWARSWVDVDGDGRDDSCHVAGGSYQDLVCYLQKPEGSVIRSYSNLWPEGGKSPARWVDLNGDGFVDVCRASVNATEGKIRCLLGPAFNGVSLVVTLPMAACGGMGDNGCETWVPGASGAGETPGAIPLPGTVKEPDFELADVNGDGFPDLCYFHRPGFGPYDLRCRIASVAANRTSVGFGPDTTAWSFAGAPMSVPKWPQGYYDFNGDGRADFCSFVPGAVLYCVLSGPNGFVSTPISSGVGVTVSGPEGAAFVDINADGNIDFCRHLVSRVLICTLSNGVSWEINGGSPWVNRELTSPDVDGGHAQFRWWVDINGDGFPDYCRLASSPDPVGNGVDDVQGTLQCRLANGGGMSAWHSSGGSNIGWGYSDVEVTGVNLGLADGGRAFCDPFGTGVPTFCRVTRRLYSTNQQRCVLTRDGSQKCYFVLGLKHGIAAGFSDSLIVAKPSLVNAFSDGVGAETRITYETLTSDNVYVRSNTTSNNSERALLTTPRSRVVFETRAWELPTSSNQQPPSLTGSARYLYKDLRTDPWAGSRGFRERWIFHEGNNTLEHSVFYQGLGPGVDTDSVLNDSREIGMVKCQEKFAVKSSLMPTPQNLPPGQTMRRAWLKQIRALIVPATTGPCGLPDSAPSSASPFVLLQATTNTLADTAQANPRFRFIGHTRTRAWDWDEQNQVRHPLPEARSTTTMDDLGNVLTLNQITTDPYNSALQWRKETKNDYLDNRTTWLLGRLVRAEVKSFAPSATTQLAAHARSVGGSPSAGAMVGPGLTGPSPIHPGVLAAILQLVLED